VNRIIGDFTSPWTHASGLPLKLGGLGIELVGVAQQACLVGLAGHLVGQPPGPSRKIAAGLGLLQ
jgi:hypothetical protein